MVSLMLVITVIQLQLAITSLISSALRTGILEAEAEKYSR
jgi:hypothetical protein